MEVLGNEIRGREEPLGGARGLKALHTLLPLACWLAGVLRPIIEIPVLAMFDAGKNLALSGSVALEFVDDNHMRHVAYTIFK